MTELASLVEDLEVGNLSLDDALKAFEKGVGLTRQCQDALQRAEQRVQILLDSSVDHESLDLDHSEPGAGVFVDFDGEDS